MANRISVTKSADRSGWRAGAQRLVSRQRPALGRGSGRFAVALVLRLAAVALLAWIGYVHWHLWQQGYRDIHINGPFFLADAIVAIGFAVLLLAWPRPPVGLLAALFTASTIGGLVISLAVGLFGFRESISASYVVESLVLESLTVVILAIWTVLAATAVTRS
jgi:hypothetical protein